MARTPENERSAIGDAYRAFRAEVSSLLFRADPMGINYDTNADEYDAEARTIVPRLGECAGPDDVVRVVHEEFVRWFSSSDVGAPERYRAIGSALWTLWTERGSAEWLSTSPETDLWPPDLIVDLRFRASSESERCIPTNNSWFRCRFEFDGEFLDCSVDLQQFELVRPGDTIRHVPLKLLSPHLVLHAPEPGERFTLWDANAVAEGAIREVVGWSRRAAGEGA